MPRSSGPPPQRAFPVLKYVRHLAPATARANGARLTGIAGSHRVVRLGRHRIVRLAGAGDFVALRRRREPLDWPDAPCERFAVPGIRSPSGSR